MALTRRTESSGESANIPNLEAGEHEGRLVYVADLGLQRKEYKGQFQGDIQQIALGIEIVGQTVEIDGEERPRYMWTKPFYIYQTLTEKGTELKMYNVFDPSASDGEIPDWEAQLGKACNVIVEHVEKDNKTYDNIKAITPIPAKYQDSVDALTMTPAIGDSEDKDNVVNAALFGLAKFVFDKKLDVPTDASDNDDGYDATQDDEPY
jgi:hypothetical protein